MEIKPPPVKEVIWTSPQKKTTSPIKFPDLPTSVQETQN